MDPGEAHAWLHGLIRPDARPWRERAAHALPTMRALLARVGDPHAELRVLHVAGSKGKGSTALIAESLLRAAGLRVGTYTSPHLQRWTERIRVDGREITDAALAGGLTALRPHVDRLTAADPNRAPGFFDVLTAAAFSTFARSGVDVAVVETGIGGRFDATNVVRPAVACITTVEDEHADKLGPGLARIAVHKAGIIKPGAVVVVGRLDPEAGAVVDTAILDTGAVALRAGRELRWDSRPEARGQRLSVGFGSTEVGDAFLAHAAPEMAANAALALACVHALGVADETLRAAAATALPALRLPGRMEIVRREPLLVVDAAHTRASIGALVACLDRLTPRTCRLLVSVSADKNVEAVLGPLLARAASVIATAAEPLRSMPAARLAERIAAAAPGIAVTVETEPRRAVHRLVDSLASGELGCVAGSTYLAGIARESLVE